MAIASTSQSTHLATISSHKCQRGEVRPPQWACLSLIPMWWIFHVTNPSYWFINGRTTRTRQCPFPLGRPVVLVAYLATVLSGGQTESWCSEEEIISTSRNMMVRTPGSLPLCPAIQRIVASLRMVGDLGSQSRTLLTILRKSGKLAPMAAPCILCSLAGTTLPPSAAATGPLMASIMFFKALEKEPLASGFSPKVRPGGGKARVNPFSSQSDHWNSRLHFPARTGRG